MARQPPPSPPPPPPERSPDTDSDGWPIHPGTGGRGAEQPRGDAGCFPWFMAILIFAMLVFAHRVHETRLDRLEAAHTVEG